MERAEVLEWDLQRQLIPYLKDMTPLPSIYIPDFIAANQKDRANNVLKGSKQEMMDKIRQDIRYFIFTIRSNRLPCFFIETSRPRIP